MLNIAALLVVFTPLVAAALVGLGSRFISNRWAHIITCGGMGVALVCAIYLFIEVALGGTSFTVTLAPWFESGGLKVAWSLKVDTLTAVMLMVVTLVSTCVHVYSVGYMHEDKCQPRFMAYLSLFTFFMLMLVTAGNLLQLFFGWEGVGLASYLLINFWYEKPSANDASIKAFIVNRVGDFGFLLGIFWVWTLFGSVNFDFILLPENVGQVVETSIAMGEATGFFAPINLACLLLFVGAMGKSAQLGLHTWLPDAMEGPTPVSALIHAATMVTAGVFMVCRLSPLFEFAPLALMVVAVIGGLTAIVAATIGLTQFDIKRVIAYSTMSQLGYMFFAAGVSAYGAAMFHLTTHAFFKALLFLGAGSVIHALHHEQDMRKMGGIWKKIPMTYTLMWIGSLALAGVGIPAVFGFAGFYSKDIILESAFADHSWFGMLVYWLGVVAAFMTAFYSWRLLIMTFHGTPRDHHAADHAHESPPVMLLPLVPLAIGAVIGGICLYDLFVGEGRMAFWGKSLLIREGNDTVEHAHHVATWVKILPLAAALSGIALAYVFYQFIPSLPARTVSMFRPVHTLFFNKWFFDELYRKVFVLPAERLGLRFWKTGDDGIIDRFGPDGIAKTAARFGREVAALQTGYVYHYAFATVVGLLLFLYWVS
ncbi:MAG: NADH-quinone oxidoreductase subunit L [Bdellovibrionales bacterium]